MSIIVTNKRRILFGSNIILKNTPTFLNDKGPNYCKSSVEFDVTEVASIEEQFFNQMARRPQKNRGKLFSLLETWIFLILKLLD